MIAYTIQYFVPPDPGASITVGPKARNFSINDPDHVGRLFVVRMRANTAGGASNNTEPLYVRSRMFLIKFHINMQLNL